MQSCYPVTRAVRALPPTAEQEPISLSEAKKQCDIADSISFHDTDMQALIVEARESVEKDAGVVCYTGTYSWKFTSFPHVDWFPLPSIRPVTSITSIVYAATGGSGTTMSASDYTLEPSGCEQFVRLAYGKTWPAVRGDINGITVTMVAGYPTVAAIPQRIKQAVKLRVRTLWMAESKDATELQKAYDRIVYQLQAETYR